MSKLRKTIISPEKGLKRNQGPLDVAAIQARWDAICNFVDNAEAYDVDYTVRYDLAVINIIRDKQRPLPTEYQVSTHTGIEDEKVKLIFNKKYTLFEHEKYFDFIAHETQRNLQAKFFFDQANKLTKVAYHDKSATNCAYFNKETDAGERVIDLTQKQANQAAADEMTK